MTEGLKAGTSVYPSGNETLASRASVSAWRTITVYCQGFFSPGTSIEYSTGTEKSFGVEPFACATFVPVETTLMTASTLRDSVATRAPRLVPGGTTTDMTFGSCRSSMTPTIVCGSPGLVAEVRAKDCTGP